MRCPSCNHDNPGDASFCEGCGAKLELICPACKASVSPGARFRKKCGTAIGPTKSAASTTVSSTKSQIIVAADGAASETIEGERKTVTALFADIKGSTELMEDLDPEEARAIVDPALKLMIDAAHRYDGYVVQSTGDGIFALFGAPVAHEDHPQRALYAALRMQEDLKRYSARVVADGSSPIQGRVGINTGEVVVRSIQTGAGQVEYTPIGHTTNLASRMQTAAPVGSIAVSEATRRLCEGYFVLKPLGATKVKGVSDPVNIYEVTSLGPLRTRLQRSAGRGLTKFVGREREMDALKHAAEQAKSGRGQIVATIGEPGVGKSRLFFEFRAIAQTGCLVLEAYSVSHGRATAYLPVLELLRDYFRIESEDDARTRREKVAGKIVILDHALEETLPYLYALLGIVEDDDPLAQMDAQTRRRRTLEALKRILLRESLNHTLIVIFEDLHWIDSETEALLNLLADALANAHILLLVNYRPEYTHTWSNRSYYTQLRLDPLGRENVQELLSALAGDAPELTPLKRMVIEKTEGNPFFLEEMVQALFDEGVLARNGSIKVARPFSQLRLPATVQGVLSSRIDRLGLKEKELLQTLAVIGREFQLSLARRIVNRADDELDAALAVLQGGEFICEQPASPDVEYVFKHALTQEVAYNSILIERRKLLHEQAGQAMESMFGAQLDDHLSELARHYSRSDNLTKAVEYLGRAGQQAAGRSAHAKAIESLNSALELLKRLPESPERDQQELALQTILGPVLMITKGWAAPETELVYTRAHELSQRCGTAKQRLSVLVGWFAIAFVGGRLQEARKREVSTLGFARQQQDRAFLLEAHHHCWSTALLLGELAAAEAHIAEGLGLYDQQLHCAGAILYAAHDPVVCGQAWGGLTSWLRGHPDEARRRLAQALDTAHKLEHAPTMAFALISAAELNQLLRDETATKNYAEAGIALAMNGGIPLFRSWGLILRGWALAKQRPREGEGFAEIREGLAGVLATGTKFCLTRDLASLIDSCLSSGRVEEGLTSLAEAMVLIQKNAERWWEAEILRLKGELLLMHNGADASESQRCFELAIQTACAQGAKSFELRATMSLARLLAQQGKRDYASQRLSEIYGSFTEGLDTADLKDAKALLEELQARPVSGEQR
jgi:predicted ATPase/class 3 adenylate cyclase